MNYPLLLGYSDKSGFPPGRITAEWKSFPCFSCGDTTWIGPRQAAVKAISPTGVICILCAIKQGVEPEDLKDLGG